MRAISLSYSTWVAASALKEARVPGEPGLSPAANTSGYFLNSRYQDPPQFVVNHARRGSGDLAVDRYLRDEQLRPYRIGESPLWHWVDPEGFLGHRIRMELHRRGKNCDVR